MKSLKRFEKYIADVSDERQNGDGYWVYLKKEYADFGNDPYWPTRQIHEQTIKSIIARLKSVDLISDEDLIKYPHLL